MRRIVLVLALPTAACVGLETASTEQSIVGGQTASAGEFPTVIALENGPGQWFCTGTIIDKSWVLTAAHCVEGETAAGLKVRLDALDVNGATGAKEVQVAAIHEHPGYDGVAWDHDVALLALATPVTDRTVTPVHRPVAPAGTQVTQVGYGDADDSGGGAGVLRKLTTSTIDCAQVMDATVSGDKVVCYDQRDGNGTCYGDSGGPSFVTVAAFSGTAALEVASITSGGTVDSCLDGFDIQTSVAHELDFIDSTMGAGPDPDPNPNPDPNPDPNPNPDPGGGGGDDKGAPDGGGCSTTGHGSAGGMLLLGLALVIVRRRRA